ncbi:hypothetical protein G6F68_013765 [Rhizopus microsporus]|nr:hypothetical protein G6F68_013765 [Rhizopus microsporus]
MHSKLWSTPQVLELGRIGIHRDDAAGLGLARTLDHRQADAAAAEHRHAVAFLHLGGVVHRADAGGDAAAEQADVFRVRVRIDLRQRHFGHYGVLAEGRAAHVVVQRLAVVAEAAGAVGHHALALGGAHLLAEVGLAGQAELALAALGRVERDDVVARLERPRPGTGLRGRRR